MIGTDLNEIRARIEELGNPTGDYYLVCGRYGDRPVPATDLRFENRTTARAAARATEQYRRTLRRYDPQLPYYDVIVCQDSGSHGRPNRAASGPTDTEGPADDWSPPTRELDGETAVGHDRVEFCHRVAGAVFETLASKDNDAVQSAVIDSYFDLADTLSDRDDLCLCLLESMATEIATTLSPPEQRAVLSTAAERLGAGPFWETENGSGRQASSDDATPVDATFRRLQAVDLLGSYTRSPWSVDLDDGRRTIAVRFSEYALSPRDGRLPTLPLAVEIYRRHAGRNLTRIRAADVEDGWHVQLDVARSGRPGALAGAPIRTEVP
jgi:hypothetical protein